MVLITLVNGVYKPTNITGGGATLQESLGQKLGEDPPFGRFHERFLGTFFWGNKIALWATFSWDGGEGASLIIDIATSGSLKFRRSFVELMSIPDLATQAGAGRLSMDATSKEPQKSGWFFAESASLGGWCGGQVDEFWALTGLTDCVIFDGSPLGDEWWILASTYTGTLVWTEHAWSNDLYWEFTIQRNMSCS